LTRKEYLAKQRAYKTATPGRRRQWRYDASEKRHAALARYEAKHPERGRSYHLQQPAP
jgi:hypothetical protein